jgi:GNAT superfamily N-acetyltransferase
MIEFRAFTREDGSAFEEMSLSLYTDDPSTEGMTTEKIRRTFDLLVSRPDTGTIVIFECDGEIAGYALLIHFWSNEYGGCIEVIDELYVKSDWRGKGIASAFLEHLERNSEDDVKGFHLEVTPRNDRARALYFRHGFRAAKNEHLFRKR